MKLSKIAENLYSDKNSSRMNDDNIPKLNVEQKKKFLEMVGSYNSYGKKIYNDHDLVEIANNLSKIVEMAEIITMNSVDESFDKITVQRNIKELKQLSSSFDKVASEAQSLKLRMTGLYEDMGNILGRYFSINEDTVSIDGDLTNDDKLNIAATLNKKVDDINPNDADVKKFINAKNKISDKIK